MLGRTLVRELGGRDGHEMAVADLPDWDITDGDAFTAKVLAAAPDLVIHCAAMTKVDDCEEKRELAFRLNEEGSRNVALAAKAAGARLIAISTDYVFSGEPPREPWAWSESDIPRPRTVYGLSKYAGEQMVSMIHPDAAILRIAWLYGAGGPSFVHTMARLGAEGGAPLKVVDDQRGNPTSTNAVLRMCEALSAMSESVPRTISSSGQEALQTTAHGVSGAQPPASSSRQSSPSLSTLRKNAMEAPWAASARACCPSGTGVLPARRETISVWLTPGSVYSAPSAAEAANSELTPGTTSQSYPRCRSIAICSAIAPYRDGSPVCSRTTVASLPREVSASTTSSSVIFALFRQGVPAGQKESSSGFTSEPA